MLLRFTRRFVMALLAVGLAAGSVTGYAKDHQGAAVVRMTWMSITNWLFEIGDTRILMDGYVTRIPAEAFSAVYDTTGPVLPDKEGIRRVRDALGGNRRIDYILTGHSHFDHTFDTAEWAKITGAHIIGSRSTCYQAFAQGVPDAQCTIVEGGEVIDLGSGVTVRVVRWNHSGDPATTFGRFLQTPLELTAIPTPDPATGALDGGLLTDFPQGGGCRAFLFTVEKPGGTISWFYSNSGNAATFEQPVIVDDAEFESFALPFSKPAPLLAGLEITPQLSSAKDNLMAAMAGAGLESVDLWLGFSEAVHVEQVINVLHPHTYVPHHWDGLFNQILDGLPYPYSDPDVAAVLDAAGVVLLPQSQYMDKFQLGPRGATTAVPNHAVKQKLGLPDVQPFVD